MMHLNAYQTAEQTVARLTREAVLNASSHLMRLELASDKFRLEMDDFDGAERDYVIGVIYSMNETVALLDALGARAHLDALLVNNLAAKAWYDAAIKIVHEGVLADPSVKEDFAEFNRRWETVRPSPKRPANADQLDQAFAKDDEIKDLEEFFNAEEGPGENGGGDFRLTEKGLAAVARIKGEN